MHNLPDLPDLKLFSAVVQAGSLARAARKFGLAPSTVSKRMGVLEARLGVRLMHRTTRHIGITEDGEAVYRWTQHLLTMADDMAQELSIAGGIPTGMLRVSTSSGFGRNHVARVLSGFASCYPKVEVRLDLLDRPVDPSAEGIDIDIRLGGIREPHLYARRLTVNRRLLCAAPEYLAQWGRPGTLADLAQHRCLVIHERDQPFGTWRLQGPAGVEVAKVRSFLSTNQGEIAHRWALDGHGIVLRSSWDIGESLRNGKLQQVLPEYSQEADVWAVHPTRLSRSPKVKVFIGLVIAHLKSLEPVERSDFAAGKL